MEILIQLTGRKKEAQGTETFIFRKPPGFTYKAGQFAIFKLVELKIPDQGGLSRHFTLCTSPTDTDIAFTTRMRAESTYKQALARMQPGSMMKFQGPMGSFVFPESQENTHVMIAGGIGVTPFRSMIRYAIAKNLEVPIHLVCSNPAPDMIPYREELDTIVKTHPHIRVSHTITCDEPVSDWTGYTGMIDESLLKKLISDFAKPIFWISGPPSMVEAMSGLVRSIGLPRERIKFEKFTGY
jgi:ferredoxin-NADP reductase